MTWIMIDVETDGSIPGDYSMVSFGAVAVRGDFKPGDKVEAFYGQLLPISDKYMEEALKVSGLTREATKNYPHQDPRTVLKEFEAWLSKVAVGRLKLISDNNGFDAMFMTWYFWHFLKRNPFGHSSTNLGSLYKGLVKDMFKNFKHLRRTRHTHNPVDDAIGNAEALVHMKKEMGLEITFE